MKAKKRGKIILIEGNDKSGKETQSKDLVKRLMNEGIPAERLSFPDYYTPTGRVVGQCYLGKKGPKEGVLWKGGGNVAWFGDADAVDPRIASMYYAANRLEKLPKIKEIILSGKHLVLDRYVESNMGHQGGKARNSKERERIIEFIRDLEYNKLKLPHPNLTLFLYMPHEIGIIMGTKMKEKKDGHESNPEHLKNAEKAYLYLAKEFGWKVIDCAPLGYPPRTPEDVHEEVYKYVKKILK
jgi:dTMP kinase